MPELEDCGVCDGSGEVTLTYWEQKRALPGDHYEGKTTCPECIGEGQLEEDE